MMASITTTSENLQSAPDCCFAKKPGMTSIFVKICRVSIFAYHLSPKRIQKCICMCQGLNY